MATHSIKIRVGTKKGRAFVAPVLPDRTGACPGDTVVWNVEATQDVWVKVGVGGFKQVKPRGPGRRNRDPFASRSYQRPVRVGKGARRARITARVMDKEKAKAGGYFGRYKYSVYVGGRPALDPRLDFCPDPPCPPPN